MECGGIEREIHVEASPEVVFEVISRPEHLREWWPDEVTLDPVPGGAGELVFGPDKVVPITVIESVPPRLFSFRWAYDPGVRPDTSNSFLVTFKLVPSGSGTILRFTETGFLEQGWEAAEVEAAYQDHASAWDRFLPGLGDYAKQLP